MYTKCKSMDKGIAELWYTTRIKTYRTYDTYTHQVGEDYKASDTRDSKEFMLISSTNESLRALGGTRRSVESGAKASASSERSQVIPRSFGMLIFTSPATTFTRVAGVSGPESVFGEARS